MPVEYEGVLSHHLSERIHRWRRARQLSRVAAIVAYTMFLLRLVTLGSSGEIVAWMLIAVFASVMRRFCQHRVIQAYTERDLWTCECGYDLRASTTTRCTECGAEMPWDMQIAWRDPERPNSKDRGP
ncbi:MAG: hypothetical protein CMJ18_00195 [Phycisphaeraceae bacterium]|nr:hypothetical protein [Phycisphaeraceae bacterium]